MKNLLVALLFVCASAQAFQLNQDGSITTDDRTVMERDGSYHSLPDKREHRDGGLNETTTKNDPGKLAEETFISGGQKALPVNKKQSNK